MLPRYDDTDHDNRRRSRRRSGRDVAPAHQRLARTEPRLPRHRGHDTDQAGAQQEHETNRMRAAPAIASVDCGSVGTGTDNVPSPRSPFTLIRTCQAPALINQR